MQRFKRIAGLCWMGILMLGMFSSVHAHTMWLNVSEYYPEQGEGTKVYFGWGHRYPVADFLSVEKLEAFNLITPKGEKETLEPGPGGFLATALNLSEQGNYIVTATLKPGFYTMYVEKGKIHHKSVPKTGLSGVILSLHFEQYAKALICAGGAGERFRKPFIHNAKALVGGKRLSKAFRKPVGHTLEIVPLADPAEVKVGDYLPVQVLFKGKPARYCSLYGTYAGFSTGDGFAYATGTDGKGKAKIRVLHHGPWLIKAKIRRPVPDALKDKCNELSYTATLTFEVK